MGTVTLPAAPDGRTLEAPAGAADADTLDAEADADDCIEAAEEAEEVAAADDTEETALEVVEVMPEPALAEALADMDTARPPTCIARTVLLAVSAF